jgi:ribosomal protein S18 acetylase RimI-like enzyme
MIIRHAERNEVAAVVALYLNFKRPPAEDIGLAELERRFDEINRSGYVAVATDRDTNVVGTYSMYFCSNLAHAGRPFAVIENVMVAPAVRRQGVGRAMMEHAQNAARQKDCYKVMLATGADSQRNIQFYESCGFSGNKIGFQVRYRAD